MKFRDLFVHRWQHSNPNVRIKAIEKLNHIELLKHMAENDDHPMVRDVAAARLSRLATMSKITE